MNPSLASSECVPITWPNTELNPEALLTELVRLRGWVANRWGGGPEFSSSVWRSAVVGLSLLVGAPSDSRSPALVSFTEGNTTIAAPTITSADVHLQDRLQVAGALLVTELDSVLRVLAVIAQDFLAETSSDATSAIQSYVGALHQWLGPLRQVLSPSAEVDMNRRAELFELMAVQLREARDRLLNEVPTVRQWVRFTRAIDPNAPLRVPKRFIRDPIRHSLDMEIDTIEAAIWARSVVP